MTNQDFTWRESTAITMESTMHRPSKPRLLDRGLTLLRNRWIKRTRPDIAADTTFMQVFQRCRAHTMTSVERMFGLYLAIRYIVERQIPGDLVECGVWRGGSSMSCAMTMLALGDTSRKIYLYDTFEGMSVPTKKDRDWRGRRVEDVLKSRGIQNVGDFCKAPLDHVRAVMETTGYPEDKIVFVKGKVEDTLPAAVPDTIALLRLDTDWYESTYHELLHLYPLLSQHGVLIIDDYGHWQGSREATDQYFAEHDVRMLLSRLDYTGRVGVKT